MSKRAVIPAGRNESPKAEAISATCCFPGVFSTWFGGTSLKVRPQLDSNSSAQKVDSHSRGKKNIVKVEPSPGRSSEEEKSEIQGFVAFDAVIDPENMMAAIKRGDLQSFRSLLKPGIDINTKGMWGNTPLIIACQYGHEAIALEILKQPSVVVNYSNEKGATALLYACLEGFAEVVQKLIVLHADVHVPPAVVYNANTDQTSPCTPLSVAITNGHLECVQSIIPARYHVDYRFPLIFDRGNLVKSPQPTGITPLMLACINGHIEIVSYIMDCKADPLILDSNSSSILHYISKAKQNSVETLIIVAKFSHLVNSMVNLADNAGDTALHVACGLKNINLVELLLKKGAHLNLRNSTGVTPLHIAVRRRSAPLVSLLIENGANSSIVDEKGISPVGLATKLGKDSAILKLLEANADVPAKDENEENDTSRASAAASAAYSVETSAAEPCVS